MGYPVPSILIYFNRRHTQNKLKTILLISAFECIFFAKQWLFLSSEVRWTNVCVVRVRLRLIPLVPFGQVQNKSLYIRLGTFEVNQQAYHPPKHCTIYRIGNFVNIHRPTEFFAKRLIFFIRPGRPIKSLRPSAWVCG